MPQPDLLDVNLLTLTDRHIQMLMKPFSQEEIEAAIFHMKPDKTLGPDGFSVRFFQSFWDVVGKDTSAMILSFLYQADLIKSHP